MSPCPAGLVHAPAAPLQCKVIPVLTGSPIVVGFHVDVIAIAQWRPVKQCNISPQPYLCNLTPGVFVKVIVWTSIPQYMLCKIEIATAAPL